MLTATVAVAVTLIVAVAAAAVLVWMDAPIDRDEPAIPDMAGLLQIVPAGVCIVDASYEMLYTAYNRKWA